MQLLSKHRRVILGFAIAALWLPLLGALLGKNGEGTWWFNMSLLATGALTILLAAPAYILLRRRAGFLICTFGGLAIGALGAIALSLVTNPMAARNAAPLFVASDAVSGIVFWLVALWRPGTSNAS